MNCGHCGTDVPNNYKVCRGCGANYRGSRKWLTLGVLFLVLAAFEHGERAPLNVVVTTAVMGIAFVLLGRRKRWYRFNA